MACSLGETEKISKEAFLYCKPRRHTKFLNRHHENGYLGNAIAKREREREANVGLQLGTVYYKAINVIINKAAYRRERKKRI